MRATPTGPVARTLVAALAMALAAGKAGAQEEQPPLRTGLTEEVRVHLVRMPILATDRHGNPVRDLKPEQIVVKDQGQRRKVAYLEPLRPEVAAAGDVPDVRLYLDAPGGWQAPVCSAESGAQFIVFFVDVENDDRLRRGDALEALVAFARDGLRASDRAAVVSFDGSLHLDLPFTSDRDALASALRLAWSREPRPRVDISARIRHLVGRFEECVISGGEFSTVVADDRCLRDTAYDYVEEERRFVGDYLDALSRLIDLLAGLQGWKTVIVVGRGVAVDPLPVTREAMRAVLGNTDQLAQVQARVGFGEATRFKMDRVLEAAVERKVIFHIVDRSLVPNADVGARRSHALQPGAEPIRAAYVAARTDMEEIAVTTGGVLVANPDLASALRRAAAAMDGGYEMGYYVDELLSTSRLAKVTVSTTRRGVRISHRRGHHVESTTSLAPLQGRIVLGPPAASSEQVPPRARYEFRIEADPRGIGYKLGGDEAAANFTLHFIVQSAEGRPLVDSFHFINHAYPRPLWESGKIAPVTLSGWVDLPRGSYTLLAIFRNTETGKEGRLEHSLEVAGAGGTDAPAPSVESD